MFERVSGKLGEITAGFNSAQKVTMAAIFVAVVAALYVFSSWASTTDMASISQPASRTLTVCPTGHPAGTNQRTQSYLPPKTA